MKFIVGALEDSTGASEQEVRKNFVTEILNEKFSLPIEWKNLPQDWAQDPVQALKGRSEWLGIWVSSGISKTLLEKWPRLTTEVRESGVTDVLVKEQNTWWFRCFLREALRESIIQHAPQLDTHSFAYIIGSDEVAGLGASVAIQLGFRRLILVARESIEARELATRIQKKYFGQELNLILDTQLTLQPSNGSLLINTLGTRSQEPILADLPYLNFLKKEGLVVDLPYLDGLQQLAEEAQHVGIRHVAGAEVVGMRDFIFLKSLMKTEFQIPREKYFSEWKSRT